jgi:hypothetical protein
MNWFSAEFRASKGSYPTTPFETWLEFFKAFNLYTPQVLLVLSIAACFYIVFKSIYLKKSLLLFNISKISIISGYIIIILYFIITKAGTSIDFQELRMSVLFTSPILVSLILLITMVEAILNRRKMISISAHSNDPMLNIIYQAMAFLPLLSILFFILDYNIIYY